MDYTQITDDIATALMSRGFARPIRRDDTTLDCVTPDGSTFRIVVGAQQPKREGKIAA